VGLHVGWVDHDGLTSVAEAGDLFVVVASAGTVDTENMLNLALAYWWVLADGMTAQQKADARAEARAALRDEIGVEELTVAVDAGNTAATFEVTPTAGAIERWGIGVFTSDNLDTEEKLVVWSGTTVTVLTPDSAVAGLEAVAAYSAEPDEGATLDFWPAR
jgi:hypothetical protein